MKKTETKTELRITDQRRIRDGLEYHLACEGARLTVHVNPSKDDGPAWRVGASVRSSIGQEAVHLDGVGASRTDAFRNLAETWRANENRHGLTMFDWEAVETLLTSVRAL
jgi:hypothetical protein